MSVEEVKANALALAKAATALEMPLIVTSSVEERAQGPLQPEFADIAPEAHEARIRRVGVVEPRSPRRVDAEPACTPCRQRCMRKDA